MKVVTIINGTEFELSTRLRVAYKVQGCHNHKPYSEVFQDIGKMTLEQQLEILFVAFQDANPEVSLTFNKKAFQEYYLENFKLKQVMNQLQGVIKGIMGDDETPENQEDDTSEDTQGN